MPETQNRVAQPAPNAIDCNHSSHIRCLRLLGPSPPAQMPYKQCSSAYGDNVAAWRLPLSPEVPVGYGTATPQYHHDFMVQ